MIKGRLEALAMINQVFNKIIMSLINRCNIIIRIVIKILRGMGNMIPDQVLRNIEKVYTL